MDFNFASALTALGPNAAFRVANARRPAGNYLFNTFLPERLMSDYHVEATNMIVRSTMAGLAAMDSPYPPGGSVTLQQFFEQSTKLAISNNLSEGAQRQLQAIMRQKMFEGTLTGNFMQLEALDFLDKVIVQPLLDHAEWMRGQALNYGALNWTFNQKPLAVDYGVPATNKLTPRTDANGDSYSDTSSAFWTDNARAKELLRYNVRAIVMNSATLMKIINNPANQIEVISQTLSQIEIVRLVTRGGNTVRDSDARYRTTITIYDEEAEVLDTTAGANFGGTQLVKFQPDGKVIYVGGSVPGGYRVGQGGTDNPRNALELGYHHIAPTVEGNGNPGRWSRLYVPEGRPMNLTGEGASNELPVLLSPEKLVIATTEMLP